MIATCPDHDDDHAHAHASDRASDRAHAVTDSAHPAPSPAALTRRAVLRTGAVAAAALTLAPTSFAAAESGTTRTRTISGHLEPGAADFVYLPVRVPRGVKQIAVSYSYNKPAVAAGRLGNSCDIGIFDEHGTTIGGRGFAAGRAGFERSSRSAPMRPRRGTCPAALVPAPGTSSSARTRCPSKAWTTRCR